jgi:glycerol kinase
MSSSSSSSSAQPERALVLSLDVGTSSVRAFVYDAAAHVVARQQLPLQATSPQPGHIEWDAEALLQQCVAAMRGALAQLSDVDRGAVRSIGIATQRSSIVTWRRSRRPAVALHPIISWQDVRTVPDCALWNASLTVRAIKGACSLLHAVARSERFKYGLRFHLAPTHSSIRFHWLLHNVAAVAQAAAERDLLFGTIDTWLVYRLTGGAVHATDVSCISATGLYDPFALDWAVSVAVLGIPLHALPQVRATDGGFGSTTPDWFGRAIPIGAVCGDQQAALFAQRCRPGDAKMTLGTSCLLDVNLGATCVAPPPGVVPLIGWRLARHDKPTWIMEGGALDCGSLVDKAVSWRLFDSAATAAAQALSVADTQGVAVVPAMSGLAAPWNANDARGAIAGLTLAADRRHIGRAVLEAIAFRAFELCDIVAARSIKVDGGVSRNAFVMQLLAVLVDKELVVDSTMEATARGAAFFAGLASGVWADEAALDAANANLAQHHYRPYGAAAAASDQVPREALYGGDRQLALAQYRRWREAVRAGLGWASESVQVNPEKHL